MRVKTAQITKKRDKIEWRSHEPSRLETFSDAVFAFAVTLIIVSLEVPKSFDELFETMKGTFSFALCFAALFQIWNNQNLFFRRYGLNDPWTVAFNGMLLFVVLIYAYPLKFLSSMLLGHTYMLNGHLREMIHDVQMPALMLIYGAGFTVIYLLFTLMYTNAKRHAKELNLDEREIFETQSIIYLNFLCAAIGVIAMLLAWLLPVEYSGLSGFFYCMIGFVYFFWLSYRGRLARKKFKLTMIPE
jgi:uncharacterized membrane protein